MKKSIFKGVATAIITPFSNEGVDYYSLEQIIKKQIEGNVSALVILGTTGEASTINHDEREEIIKFAVEACKNKCKVIVGCGSNNTQICINNYKQAERLGADGALIVTPYYNKCTQKGIIKYYSDVANSGSLPIITYNVPSRTGVNILPTTMKEIAQIPNVYGIKESSGNISQILELFRLVRDDVAIYSGDDNLNYLFYAMGGDGCISVFSNLAPKIAVKIFELCENGNHFTANKRHLEILPLINKLFIEVNPIPIKAALSMLGLCKNELRAPLTKMEEQNYLILKKEVETLWEKYDCM